MARWRTKQWPKNAPTHAGEWYVIKSSLRHGADRNGQFRVKFWKTRLQAKRAARILNKREENK